MNTPEKAGIVKRFLQKMKDPEQRQLFYTIFGAKIIGLALLFMLVKVVPAFLSGTPAHADVTTTAGAMAPGMAMPAAAATPAPDPAYVNPINTMWTLVAAFLVFFMQAGFMMLEAGFARSRETVNVLLEGIVDTCLCGLLFYAWGFAWMFSSGNGWIGFEKGYFFLNNLPATYGSTGVATLAYFLFQFAFADCASTITSGAMVGRTSFWGDLWYSLGVSGFIYPIMGHWAWGPDGWLNTIKPAAFHDFAGSTIVHTIGGALALAGAVVLGPRLGRKFKNQGGGPMPGHDMTIAAIGGVILWFGWYGFNPGSTLSAMDLQGCARVAANTTLAACAGALSALFYVYPRTKVWDAGSTINGFLAGLVAITCPCYWVSPGGSIIIGLIAGVVAVMATDLLEKLHIDDPVGAVPVHMVAGIWGTLSLGLFATGTFGLPTTTGADNSAGMVVTGLFYGGGLSQFWAQCIGSAAIGGATLVAGFILMGFLNMVGVLRAAKEVEAGGLDMHEHGGPAYPEYLIHK